MISRRLSTAAVLITGIWLCASGARAQDLAVEDFQPPKGEVRVQGSAGYGHMFDADLDQNGRVYRNDVGVTLRFHHAVNDEFSIDPIFRYELNSYDFNGADPFRWENVNYFTVGALLSWKLSDTWALLGGPVFRYAGESGADFHRSVQGGALGGFMYQPSKALRAGLLIGAISGIADKASIVPIPMVDWNFAEEWRLHLGFQQLGGRNGLGGEIAWRPVEEWEIGAGAQYENRRYRLDNNGPNVTKNGVGQESSIPVYGRLSYRPTDNSVFEIFGGAAVNGQLRVERQSGNKVSTSDYDTAPVVGVRAQVHF